MTQDEIIEMARQSGAMFDHMTWLERDLLPVFERFAKLVAEKEREAQRTWVRLTDEALYKAIEAKLKEKNNV